MVSVPPSLDGVPHAQSSETHKTDKMDKCFFFMVTPFLRTRMKWRTGPVRLINVSLPEFIILSQDTKNNYDLEIVVKPRFL